MSSLAQLMSGIVLITVPAIQYGGYFLLTIVSGRYSGPDLTGFQTTFFRAGHAHAGVLVILALVCQVLADHAALSRPLEWIARIGVVLAPVLISGGFFASAIGAGVEQPNEWIVLIYTGVAVLAASVIVLGVGLLRVGWQRVSIV